MFILTILQGGAKASEQQSCVCSCRSSLQKYRVKWDNCVH